MPVIVPIGAMPGPGTIYDALYKNIWWTIDGKKFLPGGTVICGALSRDPTNVSAAGATIPTVLQSGLLMGKVTAAGSSGLGQYAPGVLGQLTAGYGNATTTMYVSVATATEIVRRIGTSGTFYVTGPASPGGKVNQVLVTFSNVNLTTGAITVTATGMAGVNAVNQIEALPFVDNSGSGTFTLTIEGITTGPIAYNSTPATLYGNINTALNATFGTSAIVASGASLAAIILTFSGTGFAGRPIVGHVTSTLTQTSTMGQYFTINGSSTAGTSTTTTLGVVAVTAFNEDIMAGSLVQPTDGSQNFVAIISKQDGIPVADLAGNVINVEFAEAAIGGVVVTTAIVNYPTDTALQAWLKAQLRTGGGAWNFSDDF